jgi:hypothetical protein
MGIKNLFRDYVSDPATSILQYRNVHGVWPRVIFPRNYTEKILHRKVFDGRWLLVELSDKAAVYDYVKQRLGHSVLPKLYHVTSDPAGIPFHDLPNSFIIKSTHASGQTRIIYDKSELDEKAKIELISLCSQWLEVDYSRKGEWWYGKIAPRIMIQELIEDGTPKAPLDYKFWVFDGKVRFVQVNQGVHEPGAFAATLYDPSWTRLDVVTTYRGERHQPGKDIPRPKRLDEMLRAAEILGDGLGFVRADFYANDERIYFGELTHAPNNGMAGYDPPEFNEYLGSLWSVERGPARLVGAAHYYAKGLLDWAVPSRQARMKSVPADPAGSNKMDLSYLRTPAGPV